MSGPPVNVMYPDELPGEEWRGTDCAGRPIAITVTDGEPGAWWVDMIGRWDQCGSWDIYRAWAIHLRKVAAAERALRVAIAGEGEVFARTQVSVMGLLAGHEKAEAMRSAVEDAIEALRGLGVEP